MPTTPHRLGFRYYPDHDHFTARDLTAWLPELEALGAHWLIVEGDGKRTVPEGFMRGLIEAGIQPVVRIQDPVGTLPLADLSPMFRAYAQWGVRHVVVYNSPNQRSQWPQGHWARPNLVERFIDVLLPILQEQQLAGLAPVFPSLEPGGDYWDTAFLQEALIVLARRASRSILNSLVLACNATTCGHGLDWGAGGPAAWPEAQPYATPATSQDQRGFRIFEWYEAYAKAAFGHRLSTMALTGGASLANSPEAYQEAVEVNLDILGIMARGPISQQLLAFAFGPLAVDGEGNSSLRSSAWYDSPTRPGPMAEALKSWLRKEKKIRPSPVPVRSLQRYILLPSTPEAVQRLDWTNLSQLAIETHTTMGTSVDEATAAREIVLAGPTDLYSGAVLEQLAAAGSFVLQPYTHHRHTGGSSDPHAVAAEGLA